MTTNSPSVMSALMASNPQKIASTFGAMVLADSGRISSAATKRFMEKAGFLRPVGAGGHRAAARRT